jgi:hypothetical protein
MIALMSIGPTELLMLLFVILLPVMALVDILISNFHPNNKLIWVLVVIFTNIVGAFLYFLIGRNQKVKKQTSS